MKILVLTVIQRLKQDRIEWHLGTQISTLTCLIGGIRIGLPSANKLALHTTLSLKCFSGKSHQRIEV